MILILADSTDVWAAWTHRELRRRGDGDLLWIQPAELLDRVLLNWPVETTSAVARGNLIIDGRTIPFVDLTGVFNGLSFPVQVVHEDLSASDREYIIKETTATWLALMNALPCAVVNCPLPGGRPTILTGSPLLSRLAKMHGFLLPSSHCTSSCGDAILQYSAWSERVYLKPLGACGTGLLLEGRGGLEQIYRVIEHRAVSMQLVPQGQRLTVYIVGDEAVATVVQGDEQVRQIGPVPSMPTSRCLRLVRDLGLTFAECQVVVTSDGQVYCLDVVGTPNIWVCPQDVQQHIVSKLADYLSEERSLPFHDSVDGADGRPGVGQRLCPAGSQKR